MCTVKKLIKEAQALRAKLDLDSESYTSDMEHIELLFLDAIKLEPKSYEAHYGLARFIAHETTAHDVAVKHYAVAAKSKPKDPEFWALYADSLRHVGEAAKSLKAIEQAIALKDDEQYQLSKTCALAKLGKNAEAESRITSDLATARNKAMRAYFLILRGLVRLQDRRPGEALVDFKELAAKHVKDNAKAPEAVKLLTGLKPTDKKMPKVLEQLRKDFGWGFY